jgi:hypothetical protein
LSIPCRWDGLWSVPSSSNRSFVGHMPVVSRVNGFVKVTVYAAAGLQHSVCMGRAGVTAHVLKPQCVMNHVCYKSEMKEIYDGLHW